MWWETGWTTNVLIPTCDEMHMSVGNMRQRTIKERCNNTIPQIRLVKEHGRKKKKK